MVSPFHAQHPNTCVIVHSSTSHRDPAKVKVSRSGALHPRSSWTHGERWNFRVTPEWNARRCGSISHAQLKLSSFFFPRSSMLHAPGEIIERNVRFKWEKQVEKFWNLFSYFLLDVWNIKYAINHFVRLILIRSSFLLFNLSLDIKLITINIYNWQLISTRY